MNIKRLYKIQSTTPNVTNSTSHEEGSVPTTFNYPSYAMGPMESLLIVLLFILWFYALRRIYIVWSNVLNFSAIQTDAVAARHGMGKSMCVQNVSLSISIDVSVDL